MNMEILDPQRGIEYATSGSPTTVKSDRCVIEDTNDSADDSAHLVQYLEKDKDSEY